MYEKVYIVQLFFEKNVLKVTNIILPLQILRAMIGEPLQLIFLLETQQQHTHYGWTSER